MAIVTRAEVAVSAKNNLRPGLAAAAAELQRFERLSEAAQPKFEAMKRMESAAGLLRGALGGLGAGAVVTSVASATKRFADLDRQMTRIGMTGGASTEETTLGFREMRDIAMDVAAPVERIKEGMDTLTASGLAWQESIKMLPSVARTAQASGAAYNDIANSSLAVMRHLKIQQKDLQYAQDILVGGGQAGQFELKDMARYLPSLAPAAKAIGFEGTKGLSRMVAMLQIMREGSGTAEEAATNFANVMQKMESEETVTKFDKMLGAGKFKKGMDEARKSGKDLFETFLALTQQALKGDMSKLPLLFQDAQVQKGMRSLLFGFGNIAPLTDKIAKSTGAVADNMKRVTADTQGAFDRLSESADRTKTAVGSIAAILAGPAMNVGSKNLSEIAKSLEKASDAAKDKGFLAAIGSLAGDVGTKVEKDRAKLDADWRSVEDETELKNMVTRNRHAARGGDTGLTLNYLRQQPQTPATKKHIAELESHIGSEYSASGMSASEQNALSRQQLREIPEFVPDFKNDPAFIRAVEMGAQIRNGDSGKLVNAPHPPARPDQGQVKIPVQGFEEAAKKVNEVKSSVIELGPAGMTAGSMLASGFQQVNAQAATLEATLGRIAQLARSMPSIRMGMAGPSGMNTGKAMPELP